MNRNAKARKVFLLQLLWVLIVVAAVAVILVGSGTLISKFSSKDALEGMNQDGYNISNYNEIEHRIDNVAYAAEDNGMEKASDEDLDTYGNENAGNQPIWKDGSENESGSEDAVNDQDDAAAGDDINDNDISAVPDEEASVTDLQQDNDAVKTKLIAITFDDGPYPKVTNRILDILDEYGAKATFFVMGNRVHDYPSTLKREVDEGHEIGNHTYSHKQLTKLDESTIKYEVEYSNEMINEIVEVGDVVLRPPYGDRNELVENTVKVPMITWSIDSLDWSSKNKDKIFEQVISTLHEDSIILMHDLYETTADAVEELIPYLISEGYEFVTVSELFRRKGIELEAGKVYRNAASK